MQLVIAVVCRPSVRLGRTACRGECVSLQPLHHWSSITVWQSAQTAHRQPRPPRPSDSLFSPSCSLSLASSSSPMPMLTTGAARSTRWTRTAHSHPPPLIDKALAGHPLSAWTTPPHPIVHVHVGEWSVRCMCVCMGGGCRYGCGRVGVAANAHTL